MSHCVTLLCHTVSRPRKDLWHVDSSFAPASFARPQLPRQSPPFFPRLPAFFNRPQLPRQSPNFFPRSPAFFRSVPTTERVPPFFPRSSAFFARSQLPRESPLFFLAHPLYRESPQLFFLAHPHFFVRPQLPRESPPFFPRSPAFFVRPQLPRAWNRLSENLQRSCLFSTQCLRIEKSVILEFDRDQYYVLPK